VAHAEESWIWRCKRCVNKVRPEVRLNSQRTPSSLTPSSTSSAKRPRIVTACRASGSATPWVVALALGWGPFSFPRSGPRTLPRTYSRCVTQLWLRLVDEYPDFRSSRSSTVEVGTNYEGRPRKFLLLCASSEKRGWIWGHRSPRTHSVAGWWPIKVRA
jgi:hypothetical protein